MIKRSLSTAVVIFMVSVLPAFTASTAFAGDYSLTPDGSYVGGDTYSLTPDGSYVGGYDE